MKTVAAIMIVSIFAVSLFLLWAAMTIHGVYKDADD